MCYSNNNFNIIFNTIYKINTCNCVNKEIQNGTKTKIGDIKQKR